MAKSSAFVEYILECLNPLGHVTARAMFSGHNVALDGLTFGLIFDDVLYLKTDAQTLETFTSANLEPFTFEKKAETVITSYRQAPDLLENWDAFEPWVMGALEAAQRAKKPKAKKRK
jgi:DNA transformation protein and related proteins